MGYSKFLRTVFEGNPELADQQLGWEEMLDPSHYTIGHNIHPAQDQEPGTDDGTSAPPDYAGAMMPGAAGAGPPGAMPPGGMPPPDDQLQQIQPGMQQPPPAMQESEMKDRLDNFLDALLDESVEELTEGPFDWETQGNQPFRYSAPGFVGTQQAPASIAAAGPQAIRNWQGAAGPYATGPIGGGPPGRGYGGGYGAAPTPSYYRTPSGNPDTSANALNRQELERITGDYPGSRPGGGGGRRGGGGGGGGGGAGRAGGGRSGANSSDFVHSPDYVRTLQQNLTAAGFNVGRTGVDGIMGKNTRAAMKQAQDKGLDFSPGGGLISKPKGFGSNNPDMNGDTAISHGSGSVPGSTPGLAGAGAAAGVAGAGAAAARMGARPAAAPAAAPGAAVPAAAGPGAAAGGAGARPSPYTPGAGPQPGINTAKPIQNPYLNMPNGRPTPGGAPATPRPAPGLNMPTPGIKDPYLNMPNPPRGSPTPATPGTPAAAPPGAPQQGGFFNRAWQTAKNLMGDTEGKAGLPGSTAATNAVTPAVTPAVPSAAKTALRVGGKVAGNLAGPVAGGIEAYNDYQKNHNAGRAFGVGAGTMAGAAAGGAAGTAIGGPVGGVVGAGLGAAAGSPAGGWVYDKVAANPTLGPWGQSADKKAAGSFDPNSGLYVPSPAKQSAPPAAAPAAPKGPAAAPAAPSTGAPVSVSTDNKTTLQNQSKDWGMNWAEYNLLFEADRATAKRVRGY